MGEHIDNRKGPKRKKFKEGTDPLARANRVTFKSYLREIEEEFLETDIDGFEGFDDEIVDAVDQ